MKEKPSNIIGWIITAFIVLTVLTYEIVSHIPSYPSKINQERLELALQGAKDTLVREVDMFIHRVAPESCLNGLAVVNVCEEYNIDIMFVLAQGFIEGHYATKGLAAKMNNVFNVGAYDGEGTKYMKYYSHPDLSIRPYLELLKKRYLYDGRTEYDLMDKYVDVNGKRYASAPDYEDKLLSKYVYIKESTNIERLYRQYSKYKILTHK